MALAVNPGGMIWSTKRNTGDGVNLTDLASRVNLTASELLKDLFVCIGLYPESLHLIKVYIN
jgi:hypothetical protein